MIFNDDGEGMLTGFHEFRNQNLIKVNIFLDPFFRYEF